MIIQQLSNQFLIDAYIQALILKLNPNFISLLEKEIQRRNLSLIHDENSKVQD